MAHAPLIVGLIAIGVAGSLLIARLGRSAQDILRDNYRSVLAVQRMREAVEQIDGAMLARSVGRLGPPPVSVERLRQRFESELRTQEGNITEPGEREATERLRAASDRYFELHAQMSAALPEADLRTQYFD